MKPFTTLISPAELRTLSDPLIIDCGFDLADTDAGERAYVAGHIPGAHHIPLGELPRKASTVPREQPVIVHCQGGARSAIAASLLQAKGVSDVLNLAGGFNEWRAAGLPTEEEPAQHPSPSAAVH